MPRHYISNSMLSDLLSKANIGEKMALTKILDSNSIKPLDPVKLQEEICKAGGHSLANLFRGQGTSYVDILDDVVHALKIEGLPAYYGAPVLNKLSLWNVDSLSAAKIAVRENKATMSQCIDAVDSYIEEAENKILIKLLEMTYSNLSETQKKAFDQRITEVAKQFGASSTKGLAGTAGIIALGNLGGFATYTFMSTVLSTLSFGALGFGAYTAASSLLSIVLGPAGWIALGGAAVLSLGKPKLKITIPLVANMAAIRQRVNYSGRINH